MPHLRFRGCKEIEVREIKERLIKSLVEILETPEDYFTIEHEKSAFISDETYPFITVLWFDRGIELKQRVSEVITDLIKEYNYSDVCVYFNDLVKENYFENKVNFK